MKISFYPKYFIWMNEEFYLNPWTKTSVRIKKLMSKLMNEWIHDVTDCQFLWNTSGYFLISQNFQSENTFYLNEPCVESVLFSEDTPPGVIVIHANAADTRDHLTAWLTWQDVRQPGEHPNESSHDRQSISAAPPSAPPHPRTLAFTFQMSSACRTKIWVETHRDSWVTPESHLSGLTVKHKQKHETGTKCK